MDEILLTNRIVLNTKHLVEYKPTLYMKYTTPQHLNLKNNMNKVEIRVLKLCILRHEFLPTLQCFFNHSHRNALKQGTAFYLSFTFGKGTCI